MEGITRNLWTLMAAILLFAMVPVTHATTIQSAAFNDGDVFVVPGGTSANWAPQVGLTKAVWRGPSWTIRERWA